MHITILRLGSYAAPHTGGRRSMGRRPPTPPSSTSASVALCPRGRLDTVVLTLPRASFGPLSWPYRCRGSFGVVILRCVRLASSQPAGACPDHWVLVGYLVQCGWWYRQSVGRLFCRGRSRSRRVGAGGRAEASSVVCVVCVASRLLRVGMHDSSRPGGSARARSRACRSSSPLASDGERGA